MSKRKKKKAKTPKVRQVEAHDPNIPRQYKRGWFGLGFRYFGALTLLLLNVAMVMSLVERSQRGMTMDPVQEAVFFLFAVFMDVMILIPLLMECNRIETGPDGMKIRTLFFWRNLSWESIVKLEKPRMLKFAVIKTAKCFFLINKRDMKPFDELEKTIMAKISPADEGEDPLSIAEQSH